MKTFGSSKANLLKPRSHHLFNLVMNKRALPSKAQQQQQQQQQQESAFN